MGIRGGTGSGAGASNLDDLLDVNAPAPTDNQALTWDTATSRWIAETLAGGVTAINDLSDVTITTVADNQILRYDSGGAIWQNETPPWIEDITGEDLETLADVTITTIANNEILVWETDHWENQTLAENGISAVGHQHNFEHQIQCIISKGQGAVAYPDIHLMSTTTAKKISGWVLPDGASTSTINFKCVIPANLAGTPDMKARVRFLTLDADSDHAVRLTLRTLGIAVNEDMDIGMTGETEVTAECPNANDTMNEALIEIDLTTDWVAGDTVIGQLTRDPTDAVDDYAGDILIVGIELLVDRTVIA